MKPPAPAAKKQVVLCPFRTKVDNVAEEHDSMTTHLKRGSVSPFETTGISTTPTTSRAKCGIVWTKWPAVGH
mgnify:CR=1 FL=1